MKTKTIIIIEGPAGSGKSTLIRRLVDMGLVGESIESSLQKRTGSRFPEDPLESARQSLVNDTEKLTRAILSPCSTVVIDRCILSQLVYDQIRKAYAPTRTETGIMAMNFYLLLRDTYTHIQDSLFSRSNMDYPREEILWGLYLNSGITWETIQERRKGSPKTYPTGPYDYEWYQLVGQELGDMRYERNLVFLPSEKALIDSLKAVKR